jgi:hypothetical protein
MVLNAKAALSLTSDEQVQTHIVNSMKTVGSAGKAFMAAAKELEEKGE